MTEETTREIAGRIDSSPISAWDARRLVEIEDKRKTLPASVDEEIDPGTEDEDEDEDRPF